MLRESLVSCLVVAGHEQLTLLLSWVDTDGIQSISDIVCVDLSISSDVEDAECIRGVEV